MVLYPTAQNANELFLLELISSRLPVIIRLLSPNSMEEGPDCIYADMSIKPYVPVVESPSPSPTPTSIPSKAGSTRTKPKRHISKRYTDSEDDVDNNFPAAVDGNPFDDPPDNPSTSTATDNAPGTSSANTTIATVIKISANANNGKGSEEEDTPRPKKKGTKSRPGAKRRAKLPSPEVEVLPSAKPLSQSTPAVMSLTTRPKPRPKLKRVAEIVAEIVGEPVRPNKRARTTQPLETIFQAEIDPVPINVVAPTNVAPTAPAPNVAQLIKRRPPPPPPRRAVQLQSPETSSASLSGFGYQAQGDDGPDLDHPLPLVANTHQKTHQHDDFDIFGRFASQSQPMSNQLQMQHGHHLGFGAHGPNSLEPTLPSWQHPSHPSHPSLQQLYAPLQMEPNIMLQGYAPHNIYTGSHDQTQTTWRQQYAAHPIRGAPSNPYSDSMAGWNMPMPPNPTNKSKNGHGHHKIASKTAARRLLAHSARRVHYQEAGPSHLQHHDTDDDNTGDNSGSVTVEEDETM